MDDPRAALHYACGQRNVVYCECSVPLGTVKAAFTWPTLKLRKDWKEE